MKVIDLSDAQEVVQDSGEPPETMASLQQYSMGDIVSVEGEGDGIVAAVLEDDFTWPADVSEDEVDTDSAIVSGVSDDGIEMTASSDTPAYIIALEDGGSVPASSADIQKEGASISGDGEEITDFADVGASADDAEMAAVYDSMDNPASVEELHAAKADLIMRRQAAHLAEYVENREMSVEELGEYSYEELLNIPGVDDPEVGFASLPNGWTRKSVLQAWVSVGGMWRTCYARMIREFGPNRAKRWCAALKDEVLQTENWRGKF